MQHVLQLRSRIDVRDGRMHSHIQPSLLELQQLSAAAVCQPQLQCGSGLWMHRLLIVRGRTVCLTQLQHVQRHCVRGVQRDVWIASVCEQQLLDIQ